MSMSYRKWVKTLTDLLKELREDSFTGTVHIEYNEGGITQIIKEQEIEHNISKDSD